MTCFSVLSVSFFLCSPKADNSVQSVSFFLCIQCPNNSVSSVL